MLTKLSTVKSRLALTVTDYDGILTNAIEAVSVPETSFFVETETTRNVELISCCPEERAHLKSSTQPRN